MYESGPGEVDQLEDAQGAASRRRIPDRARRPAGLEDDDLARLDVADELGADDVERRSSRSRGPSRRDRRRPPVATTARGRERSATSPAASRPAAGRGRAAGSRTGRGRRSPAARRGSTRLYAPWTRGRTRTSASTVSAAGSSARSAVRSSVSVEAGSRPRPPPELAEQLAGVDEVAVVADREGPPRPEAERRLGVLPDRRAGGRVAAMGDRQLALERRQAPLVEDRGDHPEVLVEHQLLAVADRDPGRLLAAVLEGEQPERRRSPPRSGPSPSRAAGRRRTRRTSADCSQPSARGQAAVPGVAELVEADDQGVGDPAAAILGGAGRAGAVELDDEPRGRRVGALVVDAAAGARPRRSPRIGRPCWRARRTRAGT